jgi:hypothetical protein
MTDLLPCPCCGGRPEVTIDEEHKNNRFVECFECGIRTLSNPGAEYAIATWNTRPESNEARYKEALEYYADDSRYRMLDINVGCGMTVQTPGIGYPASGVAKQALTDEKKL